MQYDDGKEDSICAPSMVSSSSATHWLAPCTNSQEVAFATHVPVAFSATGFGCAMDLSQLKLNIPSE